MAENRKVNKLFKSDIGTKNVKSYDIMKLEGIRDIIDDFHNKKIDLKYCLSSIGKLSGGITVNGEIWTKYGFVQQDHNINKDGIPFDKLSFMETIFNDRQVYSQIPAEEFVQLEKGLNHLKDKVVHVLELENYYDLLDFSEKYFEISTARLVHREISIWKIIDFGIKDDRYFVARLLSKIGEFLAELTKTVKVTEKSKDKKDSVLKAFKNLVKIRNGIVHDCQTIAAGLADQNEDITQLLETLREHLQLVFCQGSKVDGQYVINYQYENAENFEKDSDKLLKYLSQTLPSSKDQKFEVNRLIKEACEIFREELESSTEGISQKRNKIKNKLKSINKQYQFHFSGMKVFNPADYPKDLSFESKEEILNKWSAIQNDPSEAEFLQNVSNNQREKKEMKKSINRKDYHRLLLDEVQYIRYIFNCNDTKKLFSVHRFLMNDHLKAYLEACKTFYESKRTSREHNEKENLGNTVVNKPGIDAVLSKLKGCIQKSQTKYEQVNEEFQEKYPEFYVEWRRNKREILNDFQQTICALCQEMSEFYGNIQVLESDSVTECFTNECMVSVRDCVDTELMKSPELKKYDYITQQAVLHLLQLILDWDKFYTSDENIIKSLNKKEYDHIISCFNKYATSLFIGKERKLCKGYRSRGLGHKMLSFDRRVFLTESFGDTLNFSEYLYYFNQVLESQNMSTVSELYDIGIALLQIHSWEESTMILKKALQRAETHPEELKKHELDEFYLRIFRKPRMINRIFFYIIAYSDLTLRDQELREKVNEIISNVNMEELNHCNIPELKLVLSYYYGFNGRYFKICRNDLPQALEWFEKAECICENSSNKFYMVDIYQEMKDFDKVKELSENISMRSDNPALTISAVSLLMLDRCTNERVTDSVEDLKIYENIWNSSFSKNKVSLKRKFGDKYYELEFASMLTGLSLLYKDMTKSEINEDKIKELIEVEKKFHEIKQYLNDEPDITFVITHFHLLLSTCYSYVSVHRNSNWDKNKECLDKAKKYLINALSGPDIASNLGQIPLETYEKVVENLIFAYVNEDVKHSKEIYDGFMTNLISEIEKINVDFAMNLFIKKASWFDDLIKPLEANNAFDHDMLLTCWRKVTIYFHCDIQQFRSWLILYYKLSKVESTSEQKEKLYKQSDDVKEILVNLSRVLMKILSPRNDSIEPSGFSIRFCIKKWNIVISYENKNFLWKCETDSIGEELRNSIKSELNRIGELLVIYIVVMKYFKYFSE